MNGSTTISQLPWTGERMVPHASDAATELFHWQRYLYFRPWYDGAKVIDAAGGEGYGAALAATTAESVLGLDISEEAITHARSRYPWASFDVADVTTADYSKADLVMSFETIEHVPDPEAFLQALATCEGRIVISTPNRDTHSPGNKLEDKPLNPYHTIEWTPTEFAELIQKVFAGRKVRFLSQEGRWPGLIREGLDENAMYCIAVIGEGDLPVWPRIGLAMPTVDNAKLATEAISFMARTYPGELEFVIVANGSNEETLSELSQTARAIPHVVTLIESEENLGYGPGANLGLHELSQRGYDLYGVTNDDVLPTTACMTELVMATLALIDSGQRVGMIGPVSNNINGRQQVQIGTFSDLPTLMYRAEEYHRAHHSSATQHVQLRGMFFLCTPSFLQQVGGFDPRFAIGNFEDDDLNLRARLAGFSTWIVDGAFMFHHGSMTFRPAGEAAYTALLDRNKEIFQWKWDLMDPNDWPQLEEAPSDVSLFVPLDAGFDQEYPVNVNGVTLDLVNQCSDIEFVNWVFDRMKVRPRSLRREVIKLLLRDAERKAA